MPTCDSRLLPEETKRFFRIWFALMDWVNQQKNIVPDAKRPYAIKDAIAIRNVLWSDDALRHAWIAANPAGLSPEDLAMARSWDVRVSGNFTLAKHFATFSLFMQPNGKAFAVMGLESLLADVVPVVPTYIRAVLIPFDDRIIYDGLIEGYSVLFGPGTRRRITDDIRRAKERDAIVTSLTPGSPPALKDPEKAKKKANESILKHFARHLAAEGLSEAVRARDVAVAEWIGEHLQEGWNLADLRGIDIQTVATGTGVPVPVAQSLTALKRFTVFLAKTERMTWEDADDLHRWLRAQGRRK